MKVVNFAHGVFFTTAALIASVVVTLVIAGGHLSIYLGYLLAVVAALLAMFLISVVTYHLGFARFLRDMSGSFILSVGLLLFMEGMLVEIFTGVPRVVPAISEATVTILGGRIGVQRLVTSLLALLVSAAVILLIKATRFGKALRAVSEDHEAATLQGIDYRQVARNGFFFGTALAGLAGCLIAPLGFVTPFTGSDYLIRAFIIVIIGGLGSIAGTVIAGFLVATVESIVSYYYDPTMSTMTLFAVVIGLLVVRPQELMGHAER